jgi:hypothetical protein
MARDVAMTECEAREWLDRREKRPSAYGMQWRWTRAVGDSDLMDELPGPVFDRLRQHAASKFVWVFPTREAARTGAARAVVAAANDGWVPTRDTFQV